MSNKIHNRIFLEGDEQDVIGVIAWISKKWNTGPDAAHWDDLSNLRGEFAHAEICFVTRREAEELFSTLAGEFPDITGNVLMGSADENWEAKGIFRDGEYERFGGRTRLSDHAMLELGIR
jgi:hypothetical protein